MSKLVFRSLLVLALLFGLLFAVGLVVLDYLDAPLWLAVAFAIGIAGLQYLVGPFILTWLFRIRWVQPAELPDGLGEFISTLCAERRIPMPRLGVIEDGNPNAFTFGHHPGNARVVVTAGLLDVLSPEETRAVLAHELGHVKHWDFVLMTAASVVPMILYTVYVWLKERDRNGVSWAIGLGAYVAYLVSQFVVLLLSRIREYYADAFAADVAGNGGDLSRALVKISYGLTRDRIKPPKKATKEEQKARLLQRRLEAAGALGIASGKAPSAFALAAVGAEGQTELIQRAMRWDLANPWAKYFELFSTHPLTAKRIRALGGAVDVSASGAVAAEGYGVGRFLVDVMIKVLPWAASLWVFGLSLFGQADLFTMDGVIEYAPSAAFYIGLAVLIHTLFSYRGGFSPKRVEELIGEVIVSDVRPVPAEISGTVVGKGIPGLFFSEDLVLQDETGFVVLDYRQPLRFLEFLFGLMRADRFIGEEIKVVGWYRRSLAPRFEVKYLELAGGKRSFCLNYYFMLGVSLVTTLAGGFFLFVR